VFEISHDHAIRTLKDIEGRYIALYRYARVPEKIRRQIKDSAQQAHVIASLVESYDRRVRNVHPEHK